MAGDQERKLKCLFLVQSRVAVGSIVHAQIFFGKTLAAAHTLGDGITREFEMDAAQERVVLLVDLERRRELGKDVAKTTGLDATVRRKRVSISDD